jgi:hypothetical protein
MIRGYRAADDLRSVNLFLSFCSGVGLSLEAKSLRSSLAYEHIRKIDHRKLARLAYELQDAHGSEQQKDRAENDEGVEKDHLNVSHVFVAEIVVWTLLVQIFVEECLVSR